MDAKRHDAISAFVERLDGDPGLAEEMALAVEYQIPLSTFLAWEYADQVAAIAFRRWRALLCPKCGSRHEDWIDEDGRYLEDPALKPKAFRCEGCAELDHMRDEIPADERAGVTVRLVRKPSGGDE